MLGDLLCKQASVHTPTTAGLSYHVFFTTCQPESTFPSLLLPGHNDETSNQDKQERKGFTLPYSSGGFYAQLALPMALTRAAK